MKTNSLTIALLLLLAGCASSRSFITSDQVIGPYSPAVKIGDLLFVSGQIAMKPGTTELAADDIEIQTRQVLDNVKDVLLKAGYGMEEVVQSTVYLKDIKDFNKMNQVYGNYFVQGRYPTRTTVEVSNLPRNARIEITVLASHAH